MTNIILQATGSPLGSIGLMVAMLAIFYFFMIRPQVKKQKEQKSFTESLQKGQQVVTTSGLHGKIEKIIDNQVTLQADTKTYLTFEASAISKELTEEAHSPKSDK